MSSLNFFGLLPLLWGKSSGKESHPAVLHMLDVAAVALVLIRQASPNLRNRLLDCGSGQPLTPDQLAFLVACHDLGKISPGFQLKVDAHWKALLQAAPDLDRPKRRCESNHGFVSAWMLRAYLEELGADRRSAVTISEAVGGHHGRLGSERVEARKAGIGRWNDLRREVFERLRDALGVDSLAELKQVSAPWLIRLAGLTTVADWIGSSHFFEYRPQAEPDAEYLRNRVSKAEETLRTIGWKPWCPLPDGLRFADLFPGIAPPGAVAAPRGIQQVVDRLAPDLRAGELLIIEAATGSGKTEASLQAVASMCREGGLEGFYYALPTQATSNQMFGRIRDFLRALPGWADSELHLLHGLRDLNDDYIELKLRSVDVPGDLDTEDAIGPILSASEWFGGRKRGLLSTVAVGTVDQAMLGALAAKHFFVRLYGLAGKVLVIDEVHAYDTYMSTIIDELLKWLRAMGSSVILLSATLPAARRAELVAAWGGTPPADPPPLPRLLRVDRHGETEQHAGPPVAGESAPSPVRLERVDRDPSVIAAEVARRCGADGGCVAVIVNTVGRSQAVFSALEEQGFTPGDDLMLFHSRFPVEDRLKLEKKLLSKLSKTGDRPQRFVVVATQVIEQSLDIDADLMISDLAPLDLMIQRVGRLHRHPRGERPGAMSERVLLWSAPEPEGTPKEWAGACLPYDAHVMLRSLLEIQGGASWRLPSDSDALLGAVYGADGVAPEGLDELWRATADECRKVQQRSKDSAGGAVMNFHPDGGLFFEATGHALRDEEDPAVQGALNASTREIDKTISVICLFADEDDDLYLDPGLSRPARRSGYVSAEEQRLLRERAATVSGRLWVRHAERLTTPPAWKRAPALRRSKLLRFDRGGRLAEPKAEYDWVSLDIHRGLVFHRAEADYEGGR